MSSIYQQRAQKLRIRIVMSGVLYLAFLVSVFSMGGLSSEPTQGQLGLMLLLILSAMLLLPRSGLPAVRVPAPRDEDEADRQFVERSQLKRIEQLALYIRLGYFGFAIFLLFLVPRLF